MRTTTTQSNLTAGELSPDMYARIDHNIYYQGLSKAQNVVIMPHGGVRRRPGLSKTKDSLLSERGKLFSFEFSSDQDYLIVLIPGKLRVYKDGVFQVEKDSVYDTWEVINEVDAAQSGDTMIFAHTNFKAQVLTRQGSHILWEFKDMIYKNIPQYKYDGTTEEDVWSDTRGWGATVTFFQSRLWFGGSKEKPNSVWATKINGFVNGEFDFDIGTGQPDYGIFDTLDTDQYNRIVNIYAGRNLMVLTTGSEFYNKGAPGAMEGFITPETSSWKRSTSFGSKRVRPVSVDGAMLFVDRVGRTVRSSVFEFQEDAYIAPSISLVSNHLITNVIAMDAVKGTNIDISDFVYVLNDDGTVAVLNTVRSEQIQGWTQWTTQGKFRDVRVVNKIVYFLVERQGEFHIEYMNEGTTLDHNTFKFGTKPVTNNVVHLGKNVTHNGHNVIWTDHASGVPITSIDTGESAAIAALKHKVLLDNSVMADSLGGVITFSRPAFHAEAGLDVPLVVRTMPLNAQVQDGVSLNQHKRVVKLMLNMRDSLGVYGFDVLAPDRHFTVVLDEATKPFSGLKEVFMLGYGRVVIIEVNQKNPLPFKLLGLGYETNL